MINLIPIKHRRSQNLQIDTANPRNRIIILSIALLFMVINTIVVILVCNTQLISEYDKYIWNVKIALIINGVCFGCLFVALISMKYLTIKKLFLIFLITRVVFLFFFIAFNYGVEIDFSQLFYQMPIPILNGQIFTPYSSSWVADWWRVYPPMWVWWYTYNYVIYALEANIWRIVNLLLEVGIVYVMIQMFYENSGTEKGWKEKNFKIGLIFYIFSFIPIVSILLYANIVAFPVLLGIIGMLFFLRSKKNPKYLYYSIIFFCLAALTTMFAAIWILIILFTTLLQRNFRRLFILIGEILAVFCLVCLPFLINDAIGFIQRLVWQFKAYSVARDGTIWVIDWSSFNWPEIISYIPASIALILSLYYIYKNYKSGLSLDVFIVIICLFEFFTPAFSPWHYLWIFPLLCLTIMYSFRKFFITNLFFVGFFLFFCIWQSIAYLTYPEPLSPDIIATWADLSENFMVNMGYFDVYTLIGQLVFQMGFVYLIYSYTQSKKLILGLFIPFIIYYVFTICFPVTL